MLTFVQFLVNSETVSLAPPSNASNNNNNPAFLSPNQALKHETPSEHQPYTLSSNQFLVRSDRPLLCATMIYYRTSSRRAIGKRLRRRMWSAAAAAAPPLQWV